MKPNLTCRAGWVGALHCKQQDLIRDSGSFRIASLISEEIFCLCHASVVRRETWPDLEAAAEQQKFLSQAACAESETAQSVLSQQVSTVLSLTVEALQDSKLRPECVLQCQLLYRIDLLGDINATSEVISGAVSQAQVAVGLAKTLITLIPVLAVGATAGMEAAMQLELVASHGKL